MTPDERIAVFLNAARPARADAAFDAQVMQGVARAAFLRSVRVAAVGAAAGGVVLWALAPILAVAVEPAAQALLAGTGVLMVTLCLLGVGVGLSRKA